MATDGLAPFQLGYSPQDLGACPRDPSSAVSLQQLEGSLTVLPTCFFCSQSLLAQAQTSRLQIDFYQNAHSSRKYRAAGILENGLSS